MKTRMLFGYATLILFFTPVTQFWYRVPGRWVASLTFGETYLLLLASFLASSGISWQLGCWLTRQVDCITADLLDGLLVPVHNLEPAGDPSSWDLLLQTNNASQAAPPAAPTPAASQGFVTCQVFGSRLGHQDLC